MNCPPPPAPETAACFQQSVNHGYAVEFHILGMAAEFAFQVMALLAYGVLFWALICIGVYANFGWRIGLLIHRLAVVTNVNERTR